MFDVLTHACALRSSCISPVPHFEEQLEFPTMYMAGLPVGTASGSDAVMEWNSIAEHCLTCQNPLSCSSRAGCWQPERCWMRHGQLWLFVHAVHVLAFELCLALAVQHAEHWFQTMEH